MPRPKTQTIYTLPGTSLDEAKATLRERISDIISVANQYPGSPIDRALEAASEKRLRGFLARCPVWVVLALLNLRSNVDNGDYHLRRCAHCRFWMLVKDERRLVCVRAACRRAARAQQKRQQRAAERDLDRGRMARARAQRTRKGD